MTTRVLALSTAVWLANAAAAPAAGFTGARDIVSPSTFVLDGGELERLSGRPGRSLLWAAAAGPASVIVLDSRAMPAPRPRAFDYSDGYRLRLKIHKYASFATLPLFAAQYVVGQRLYDGKGSDGARSAHGALAASTAVLFGVNTVTGGWNLFEGRKDPNRRTKRMIHGVLMLAADAGFAATGLLAPDDEGRGGSRRSTHRTVALSSMGVAAAAYLMMLIH